MKTTEDPENNRLIIEIDCPGLSEAIKYMHDASGERITHVAKRAGIDHCAISRAMKGVFFMSAPVMAAWMNEINWRFLAVKNDERISFTAMQGWEVIEEMARREQIPRHMTHRRFWFRPSEVVAYRTGTRLPRPTKWLEALIMFGCTVYMYEGRP